MGKSCRPCENSDAWRGNRGPEVAAPKVVLLFKRIRQSRTLKSTRRAEPYVESTPRDLSQLDHIQRQRRRLHGKAREAVVCVEGFGGPRDRVHDRQPRRDFGRGELRAPDGVGEQGAAEPLALPARSIAGRPSTTAGRNFGMFRRMAPVASWARICPMLTPK